MFSDIFNILGVVRFRSNSKLLNRTTPRILKISENTFLHVIEKEINLKKRALNFKKNAQIFVSEAETQGSFEVPEYSFYAPNPDHVRDLVGRSGYEIIVSTGQRKYGGPPPPSIWTEGMHRGKAELFIGSLHRDAFEPHIVPLIEEIEGATIYEVRLMMGYDGKENG